MARQYLTLRRRWWVPMYLVAVTGFLWSVSWALDEDDASIHDFIDRVAKFIATRGFYVASTDTDPGEV